jgi:hypothetical protein
MWMKLWWMEMGSVSGGGSGGRGTRCQWQLGRLGLTQEAPFILWRPPMENVNNGISNELCKKLQSA